MQVAPALIFTVWMALAAPALAFDAGGFALQQHQHQLLRQQTAPNNADERPSLQKGKGRQTLHTLRARYMRQLRPEYERRVRLHGVRSANAWLENRAYRLGQKAARGLRSQ